MKWFTLAAKQGDADAQYYLGEMYADGDGVPRNLKTAIKWYTRAAEKGKARAQDRLQQLRVRANLGAKYANGEGVIKDYVYAHTWWNIAAAKGDEDAAKNRDIIEKKMTPYQIGEAWKLARECAKKNYKRC